MATDSTLLGTVTESVSATSPISDQKSATVTTIYPPEKSGEQEENVVDAEKVRQ